MRKSGISCVTLTCMYHDARFRECKECKILKPLIKQLSLLKMPVCTPWNHKWSDGMAARILNLVTKRMRLVSFTCLPFYPWWAPQPFCTRSGREVYLVTMWNRTKTLLSPSLYPCHCTDWAIPLTHSLTILVLCPVLRHHQIYFFHPFSLLRIM